jgi:hypothetical protein
MGIPCITASWVLINIDMERQADFPGRVLALGWFWQSGAALELPIGKGLWIPGQGLPWGFHFLLLPNGSLPGDPLAPIKNGSWVNFPFKIFAFIIF